MSKGSWACRTEQRPVQSGRPHEDGAFSGTGTLPRAHVMPDGTLETRRTQGGLRGTQYCPDPPTNHALRIQLFSGNLTMS